MEDLHRDEDDTRVLPAAPGASAAPQGGFAARAPRKRVLKGATAAFNHEFSAIPCLLREISDTGARLIFEGGWFAPDRFTLHVALDGYKVECERVWQRGSECGVRFLGERQVIGKPRQQVLTPEALPDEDDTTASAAPAPWGQKSEPPLPLPAGGPRRPGFGRRTR
ncbi:hypothetical protein AWJ14_11525 [Hoeflea olei]|uniref:PilZ domain-containing protein n=2 Tax=Hoeflea olei TaxID=1480615 RepID=A0A1C1YUI3_9HYPH|nr:hypothetical protein AWJ14_11525 [Hoeflea olei]